MGMYGQLGGLLLWLMNVVGEERGISVRGDVIYIYIHYIYIYVCSNIISYVDHVACKDFKKQPNN